MLQGVDLECTCTRLACSEGLDVPMYVARQFAASGQQFVVVQLHS
jgi:hypothetical protein